MSFNRVDLPQAFGPTIATDFTGTRLEAWELKSVNRGACVGFAE